MGMLVRHNLPQQAHNHGLPQRYIQTKEHDFRFFSAPSQECENGYYFAK